MLKKYKDVKEKVGKYFTAYEFACRHCGECVIDTELIKVLDCIREGIGNPVIVNSGYRCEKHNKEVGGSPNSQHKLGTAADISCSAVSVKTLYKVAEKCLGDRGGLGYYPVSNFVHVDVRKGYSRWYEAKKGTVQTLTLEKKKVLGLV